MVIKDPPDTSDYHLHGIDLLHDPNLNKGTAFTQAERQAYGLRGLLPPHVATMDEQLQRLLENIRNMSNDLDKHVALINLQERNRTLFYRLLIDNMEEFMPIVYTPTVGKACQLYGHIFQRPQGVFVSLNDAGHVNEIIDNWHEDDVRVVVVTDGERILGLGDLGANGMGIPVGKLSLYTACAGISPRQCLPVTIDVGTNNSELLDDPLYLGLRQPRARGDEYDSLIDEFISAVRGRYPNALIQFEDFGNKNAFRLLNRYRDAIPSFNDDIQGTAAVTLAGIYSALRITGQKLTDQRILFFGAGEAGIGIGDLVVSAMMQEGLSEAQARHHCWFVDSQGLVVAARRDHLQVHKLNYAHDYASLPDLQSAVDSLKPTILIGVSGVGQTFTRSIVQAMASYNDRPVIFALSNPTSNSECTAAQAYQWSDGRVIFASGSPFDPVTVNSQRFVPGQGNNAYVFPGIGLGVVVGQVTKITDEIFRVAAMTLADLVQSSDLEMGRVYPALSSIRDVSAEIAAAVWRYASQHGCADRPLPDDPVSVVRSEMYDPQY